MKKYIASLLIIAMSLGLISCGNSEGIKSETETTKVEETQAETELDENQIEKAQEEQVEEKHEYMPDKNGDSYYCILEDQFPLEVKTQESGTCWTCSMTSSMEATYHKNYGEEITFDPTDLCLKIYDDDKSEGWFVNMDKLFYGGWSWMGCEYLPNGYAGYYLKDAWRYDEENSIDDMKEGVKNYGPIIIAVCDNTSFKRTYDGYFTMNDDNPEHMDHAVVIVGWDDNFPKDYFKLPAKENGAWICQNSKSKGWGNDGLYYVSYESIIDEKMIFSMTNEYSDVAYYDAGNEKQISLGEKCSVANVFSKKGKLSAVGTYTNSDYQKFKIEVLDGEFGELLCEVDGTSDIKGYHVTDLPESIDVEDYTIVITFDGPAAVEGESYSLDDNMVEYVATSARGQSFVKINDEWVDMSADNIKEKLGIDFSPNNACIKAYYTK